MVEFGGHDMRRQRAPGLGSWMQCENCGATNHGGYWWLAGYKSKDEPKCAVWPIDEVWQAAAIELKELSAGGGQ